MTARLVYAFDPLCGWCYGFAPALRAVRAAFPDTPVVLRFGGLVTGSRIGPYAGMRGYIEAAEVRLRAVTGVGPGADFHRRILRNPRVTASSIPPCDALLALRETAPAALPDYADALQTAHFRDGEDYGDPAFYARIARDLGLDFAPDIPAPRELRPPLAAEFAAVRAMGVASYPTLLLETGGEVRAVPVTYAPDAMVAALRDLVAA